MIVVLVTAAGAGWESNALGALAEDSSTAVLKRCMDIDDLLATAARGQAQAAVVGLDAPGLDSSAIGHLAAHGVRVVMIAEDHQIEGARVRAERLGIDTLIRASAVGDLPAVLREPERQPANTAPRPDPHDPKPGWAGPHGAEPSTVGAPDRGTGAIAEEYRVITVWGPSGAPGRSTLATALAGELARRRRPTCLIDADPHAASLAQALGVVEDVSGVLAATRDAAAGRTASGFEAARRSLDPHLSLLSGLPRPDRWVEVKPGALDEVVAHARTVGHVVLDTGSSIEVDPSGDFAAGPGRNDLTLSALESADEIVVVGLPDPPGLARLARALMDLREVVDDVPVRLVVNRTRKTLGWSNRELGRLLDSVGPYAGLTLLPEDQAATDRALVSGRPVIHELKSPLTRAVGELTDALVPATKSGATRRKAGTVRRR